MSELKKFQVWAEDKCHYQTTDALYRYTKLLWSERKDMNEQAIQKKILSFLIN